MSDDDQVDRLRVIAHWIATPPGADHELGARPDVITDESDVADYRAQGWTVTGPFVAERQPGAVERFEQISALAEDAQVAFDVAPGSQWKRDGMARLSEIIAACGGQ